MNPMNWILRLRTWLRDESGQATTEYMTVTLMFFALIFLVGFATPFSAEPIIGMPVKALQKYVDYFFYCIDVALN